MALFQRNGGRNHALAAAVLGDGMVDQGGIRAEPRHRRFPTVPNRLIVRAHRFLARARLGIDDMPAPQILAQAASLVISVAASIFFHILVFPEGELFKDDLFLADHVLTLVVLLMLITSFVLALSMLQIAMFHDDDQLEADVGWMTRAAIVLIILALIMVFGSTALPIAA